MSAMRDTLGNKHWLALNEPKLRDLLPETWTHMDNLNGLQIGYRLKLLGVDWRSEHEFALVMLFLEKVGIMQRQNDYQVRANPRNIFAQ